MQTGAQSTEPHLPGLTFLLIKTCKYLYGPLKKYLGSLACIYGDEMGASPWPPPPHTVGHFGIFRTLSTYRKTRGQRDGGGRRWAGRKEWRTFYRHKYLQKLCCRVSAGATEATRTRVARSLPSGTFYHTSGNETSIQMMIK